ncbi:MAG: M20/M25/M40 family metallo-hydrolase [Bacteroidetes bacterium]|nr:MAG: M20/M25/M40 family metallo-hydrolase [Bacteroidota bacterium]
MMNPRNIVYTLFLIAASSYYLYAQPCTTLPQDLEQRLRKHVEFLADDKLEGRQTGSLGEKLALDYLNLEFLKLGLKPLGERNYGMPFTFQEPVEVGPNTRLQAGGRSFEAGTDFYPLSYSANASLENVPLVDVGFGIEAPELEYTDYQEGTDYQGKVFLMNFSSPDGVHPHSKYLKYHDLAGLLATAKKKGAAGVIVYNPEDYLDDPPDSFKYIEDSGIPVVFVVRKHADFFKTLTSVDQLRVEMKAVEKTAHNAVALLDNGAPTTVVIGAHYDHLGWGGAGSLYREGRAIHNGADDNASGTAALIELAALLKEQGPKNNNYLFIAFSGEEKGLYGSKFFVEHSPIPLEKINYMINMDMVGRMKDHGLVINGVGTSPVWKEVLPELDCYGIQIQTTESGVGPSDHTSFYLKDLPVLHFFTGAHEDYHRPSDDADKLNYEGLAQVVGYIYTLIRRLDGKGKLPFTKTEEEDNQKRPRFSVTLGVMPDYVFAGPGMRLDGVTEGKPAHQAGMQKGDIILQIGELPVKDVMSYMKALSMFKKGDETTAVVKRGEEELTLKVVF